LQENLMSPNADEPGLIDKLGSVKKTTAQGLSFLWGTVLDNLSDKHAKAAAAWTVNQEGGVGRTADGILVTSKELVMQVLLNSEGNYTIEGYQPRMKQSIGVIYLGMDWGPEYVKQSTKANEAIGLVSIRVCAPGDSRRAGCPAQSGRLRHPGSVGCGLCRHLQTLVRYPRWRIREGGRLPLVEPAVTGPLPGRLHPPSGYIVHPDPDFLLTHIGQRTGQILKDPSASSWSRGATRKIRRSAPSPGRSSGCIRTARTMTCWRGPLSGS
jgi:hypothetical protein